MQRRAVNPWDWSLKLGYNQAEIIEGATRHVVCAGQTAVGGAGHPHQTGGQRGHIKQGLGQNAAGGGGGGEGSESGNTCASLCRPVGGRGGVRGVLRSASLPTDAAPSSDSRRVCIKGAAAAASRPGSIAGSAADGPH